MTSHVDVLLQFIPSVLTEAFVRGLWQGTATILLVAAAMRAFPRAGAQARYATLIAAFVLLAVVQWVHLPYAASEASARGTALHLVPWMAWTIASFWALMAALRATQLFQAYRHLCAVSGRATPLNLSSDALQPLISGPRRVTLCSSADVDSPTVLGFRRPRLLLPEWLIPTLTPSDLEQIALHECEHLRRWDDWANLLQQIALLLFPLHPALFWLDRRLHVQRELACDAGVIARTAQAITYASCLTRLAEQRQQQRRRIRLALAAWEQRSELATRVHTLLGEAATWTPRQSRCASVLAVAVLTIGALLMAAAPELVRIAPGSQPRTTASSPGRLAPQGGAVSEHGLTELVAFHSAPAPSLRVTAPPRAHRASLRMSRIRSAPPVGSRALLPTPAQPTLLRTVSTDQVHTIQRSPGQHLPVQLRRTKFIPAYAAVPFGDGWLLFQL